MLCLVCVAAAGPVRGAEGLSLRVVEIAASVSEGGRSYDRRFSDELVAKLENAGLAYNVYQWKDSGSSRLTVNETAHLLGRVFVKLLPTSAARPEHGRLDVSIRSELDPRQEALHTQTFLKSGGSILFHIPSGSQPPSGTIFVLSLSGEVPPPPE